jgi:hypothetical protein
MAVHEASAPSTCLEGFSATCLSPNVENEAGSCGRTLNPVGPTEVFAGQRFISRGMNRLVPIRTAGRSRVTCLPSDIPRQI